MLYHNYELYTISNDPEVFIKINKKRAERAGHE